MNQVTLAASPKLAQSQGSKRDRESFAPGYMGVIAPSEDRFRRTATKNARKHRKVFNMLPLLIGFMAIALLFAVALLLSGQPLLALAPTLLFIGAALGSAHPQVMEALAMPFIERR